MALARQIAPEDVEGRLDWTTVVGALEAGHRLPRAQIADILLHGAPGELLNRAAWIEGLGLGVKAATIFPGNRDAHPPRPSVQAAFLLFDEATGAVSAVIDGEVLTSWKTAGDSVLGARLLARPDSRRLLVVGGGAIARALVDAYAEIFPNLQEIAVWARDASQAEAVAAEAPREVRVAADLGEAAGKADIISSATGARAPILKGAWIRPGTHVDLIGAHGPDMREADDDLIRAARLFVDSRETTIGHIGELRIPIAAGVISAEDVVADLYDLCGGGGGRRAAEEITLFKNGGGAHLDLMTADLLRRVAG